MKHLKELTREFSFKPKGHFKNEVNTTKKLLKDFLANKVINYDYLEKNGVDMLSEYNHLSVWVARLERIAYDAPLQVTQENINLLEQIYFASVEWYLHLNKEFNNESRYLDDFWKVIVDNETLELEVHNYFNEDTPPMVYKMPSKGVLIVEEDTAPNSDSTYLTVEFEGCENTYQIKLQGRKDLIIDEFDEEGDFYDTIGLCDFLNLI